MPFRKAWLWVLALLALTFVAFWPGYFSKLPVKKLAHHYHAASAVLWMVLAIVQSWTIHHDRVALHRKVGLAIFLLFPFFLVAGIWVIHVEATTLAAGLTDPENLTIAQFGFFDPLANIGFAALFWGGLKYRHKVHLHARYMLATLLFVVSPIGFRLINFIPALNSDTPETAYLFSYAMAGGNLMALAIALYLYRQAPKHGRPLLIAAGFIAAQEITFETLGRIPAWAPVFASVSQVNLPLLLTLTGIAALGIAWHGWVAGARPSVPKAIAVA
ncbi:hypothetical protein [Sphingomonas sp.]|uniref:hypothetical protein n=1 Tax=Sphingomonas sp. TaxID=28214 RepID=UPI0025D94F2E|nr:hypothetical protein [Sphingomonas sp.]